MGSRGDLRDLKRCTLDFGKLWTPKFQKKGKLGCKECMDCAETLNTDVKIDYLQEYMKKRCDNALVLEKSARESLDLQIQFLACDV